MTGRVWVLLVLVLGIAASAAHAQTEPAFPVAGTVVRVSPVLVPREDSQSAVVMLQTGTVVQILGRQGFWFRVLFPSPEGEREGLLMPEDLRIDPDAVPRPSSGPRAIAARGFVELRGFGFPYTTASDSGQLVGDALIRQDLVLRPARWLQFTTGVDLRASSQPDVDESWTVDLEDRGVRRPRLTARRLSAAVTSRHISLDVGRQFIRWGRSDILSPVDRFAPRDFLNVLGSEFLPVIGARASLRAAGETVEVVWLPQMTPSRLPLLDRRWAVVPAGVAGPTIEDRGSVFPTRSVQGLRWSHAGRFDIGLSVYDGFHHLPEIEAALDSDLGVVNLTRTYPRLRSYGGEMAVPTSAVTLKAEAAFFTSPSATSDEYVLYVVEAERQAGEWLLTVGYAGDLVTTERVDTLFPAERGLARSIIGRAAYTIDPRRTFEVEGAARQNGEGVYVKGTFSQSFGAHWRLTLAAVGLGGADDDFLGQYQRNSHASATLRLSY